MADALSCPISFPQATPGAPVFHRGDPWQQQTVRDLVNSIPRAHDLLSVITALNVMNSIITQITHSAPQVNNTFVPGAGSVTLQGIDHKPDYIRADWIEENREYEIRHAVNPDDKNQKIPINVLTRVDFHNVNNGSLLIYDGSQEFA
jgi:hypothetical protein